MPHTTDEGDEKRHAALLAGVFAVISALAISDVLLDVSEGASLHHSFVEASLALAGLVGFGIVLRRLLRLSRQAQQLRLEASTLKTRLDATAADASRWRAEARDLLDGLGVVIDRQLTRWALSPAEKEVALLLLKGLSHKEVAVVRKIGEATARQQARAVYRKAGLTGRHDLAAFFLEDMLLPAPGDSSGAESEPEAKV